jgi:hypothetical protein
MNKRTLMITLLLAFFGCLLIVLSIFFLYQSNSSAQSEIIETKKQLEEANKKIEKLSLLPSDKGIALKDVASNGNKASSFSSMIGHNIPLIEITDMNLSDEETLKGKGAKYTHQLRFYIFNIGNNSLKDVIVSIKDIYNDPKDISRKSRTIGHHDDAGPDLKSQEIGTYENFEINTLNLKSRRLIYATTLPSSFGVAEYSFHIIVEWKGGFYQQEVKIEEYDGKLKYINTYYDVSGKELDFSTLEKSIIK